MALSESQRKDLAGLVGEAGMGETSVSPGTQEEVAAVLAFAHCARLRLGAGIMIYEEG